MRNQDLGQFCYLDTTLHDKAKNLYLLHVPCSMHCVTFDIIDRRYIEEKKIKIDLELDAWNHSFILISCFVLFSEMNFQMCQLKISYWFSLYRWLGYWVLHNVYKSTFQHLHILWIYQLV